MGRRVVYQTGAPARLLPAYEWTTYGEAAEERTLLGSGLLQLVAEDGRGAKIGLLSANRPKWMLADLAIQAYSLVNVALYDTLGPHALEFIINHAEIAVVLCGGDRVGTLLAIAKDCPSLRCIVSMDALDNATGMLLQRWSADRGVRLLSWGDVLTLGRERPLAHRPPRATDICAICYTSGTTGDPKGAITVHRMPACAIRNFGESGIVLDAETVHLSYLPLAHCYEKTFVALMCYYGGRVGFHSGDMLRLAEDAQVLRPTIFLGVPRVYNKMYDAIRASTIDAPGVKGVVARAAFAAKLQNLATRGVFTHAVWDRALFGRVAAVLGGRVRYFITGSAPVDHRIMQFFRVMFSCEFCEGYGATESCAYGAVLGVGDFSAGNVGRPPVCCEVKLVAVPEMAYSVAGETPRGELCYRGPFVFPGYYKDPVQTAEAVDADGWLHTGDIAAYNPAAGTISIIDRKKNIFKLSQGEYVAPEKLELVYINCNWVAQIFVHGDSLKSDLVAVIVPKEDVVQAYFGQQGRAVDYADAGLHAAIAADLQRVAREYKLNGYEHVRAFHLDRTPFTIENDLLTPTFKLKRHQARLHYAQEIDMLYRQIEGSDDSERVVASKI